MTEERTPDEIHKSALAEIDEMWKSGQIKFGQYRVLVARADYAYRLNKEKASNIKKGEQ